MKELCDISHYQTINWDKYPYDTVIMKATEGLSFVDPKFSANQKSARDKKILCGYYHFVDGNNMVLEAEHFLSTIGELQNGEFLALDYEIHLENPVQWCKSFLDYCFLKTGVKPYIYINQATLNGFDWTPCKDYPLWIARYGANPVLKDFPVIAMWQHADNGQVAGITGNVDMDTAYIDPVIYGKTYADLGTPTDTETTQEIAPVSANNAQTTLDTTLPVETPTTQNLAPSEVLNQVAQVIAENATPTLWEKILGFLESWFNRIFS